MPNSRKIRVIITEINVERIQPLPVRFSDSWSPEHHYIRDNRIRSVTFSGEMAVADFDEENNFHDMTLSGWYLTNDEPVIPPKKPSIMRFLK